MEGRRRVAKGERRGGEGRRRGRGRGRERVGAGIVRLSPRLNVTKCRLKIVNQYKHQPLRCLSR